MKLKDITLGLVAVGSLTFFSVSYLTTPRRVARLVAELCRPEPGMSCYDPCCGSGRLPRAVQNAVIYSSDDRMQICAQEINPIPFLAAMFNRRWHHLNMSLQWDSSLHHPAFTVASGKLKRFDLAVANPMWNQPVPDAVYRGDRFERFRYGWPSDSGDWVWMQHLLAHLADSGRMVVCLDREAMSRCDDPAEVAIRRRFVDADLIEAVIRCPWEISRPRWLARGNILNTPQAALVVVNKNKKRSGEILFVNSRPLVQDYLNGNLTPDAVHNSIMNAVRNWTTVSGMVEILSNTDVAKTGYVLAPEMHCASSSMTSCYRQRGAAQSFLS
jgi:type I restriction enzyme M protein